MSQSYQFKYLQTVHEQQQLHKLETRIQILKKLLKTIEDSESKIIDALLNDLGKSKEQTLLSEYLCVVHELNYFIRNLKQFAKPVKAKKTYITTFVNCYTKPTPLGPTLIFVPFNYPFQLALMPLIGALAAGNPCLLEITKQVPHTIEIIKQIMLKADLLGKYVYIYDKNDFNMLPEKFACVFFTGSTKVGKIIAGHTASTLTRTILELGGPNPLVVAEGMSNTDIELSIQSIIFGKFMNAGQICISPNYLCYIGNDNFKYHQYIKQLKSQLHKYYYDTNQEHLCQIINSQKYEQLTQLVGSYNDQKNKVYAVQKMGQPIESLSQLVEYCKLNAQFRKFPPTLIETNYNDKNLFEEAFGPILFVFKLNDIQEFISFYKLNYPNQVKPLAAYLFSTNKQIKQQFIQNVQAGSIDINQTIMHIQSNLPFGGLSESGLGSYHGKHSFETFSHYQPVYDQSRSLISNCLQKMINQSSLPPYKQLPRCCLMCCYRDVDVVIIATTIILFVLIIVAAVLLGVLLK